VAAAESTLSVPIRQSNCLPTRPAFAKELTGYRFDDPTNFRKPVAIPVPERREIGDHIGK
jgi:hypothetical protein